MIAYIGWISIIMIQWSADCIRQLYKSHKFGVLLTMMRMKLLGINLLQKKSLFGSWKEDLWIIPITSLLPAAVIGFLANHILEEKFLLECDAKLKSGDICYENGEACCIVISSHHFDHLFDFAGKLASNILAAFGVIRIIGWFMITNNKKIRHMVKKYNK